MRKLLMMSAALAAGMLSLSGATSRAAQPTRQTAAKDSMKVTGMVTEANQDKQQIVVDGQTFRMAMAGGAAVWPQVGDSVILHYQERNGHKTVTSIGQVLG